MKDTFETATKVKLYLHNRTSLGVPPQGLRFSLNRCHFEFYNARTSAAITLCIKKKYRKNTVPLIHTMHYNILLLHSKFWQRFEICQSKPGHPVLFSKHFTSHRKKILDLFHGAIYSSCLLFNRCFSIL